MLAQIRHRLDGCSNASLFVVVAGPLLVVYLATTSWWVAQSPDTFTNTLTANSIANRGTLHLDADASLTELGNYGQWIVPADHGRLASQYQPATALHAVPAYLLTGGDTVAVPRDPLIDPPSDLSGYRMPPAWPGAVTAAILTAGGMGILALTFRRLCEGSTAATAAAVAGLGTSAWSVAADELWHHSPGILWIALLGYALSAERTAAAAVAGAVAVVVRPVNAVIPVGAGLLHAVRRRWATLSLLAIGVAIGSAVALTVNVIVFGELSLQAGQPVDWLERAGDRDLTWFPANAVKGLFHPRYGLFAYSPFLVVLAFGLPAAWRRAPDWARGPAIGAALSLIVQWGLNRASGGAGYYFYRYPLEALTAAAPVLLLAYLCWVRERPLPARLFRYGIVAATAAHLVGAVSLR